MAKRPLIRISDFPYHITARSNNKEWFYLPIDLVWKIFNECILGAENKYNLNIFAYVLMNNHFHMLTYTPDSNIDSAMRYILKNMADKINKQADRINHVFGGPYKWTIESNESYYMNVIRYIVQNPIRAKICNDIREYEFLKINWDKIDQNINININNNNNNNNKYIDWFNQISSLEENEAIKKGLGKRKFDIAINRKNRNKIIFDKFN